MPRRAATAWAADLAPTTSRASDSHLRIARELRRRGWKDAIIYLPHDGVATNNITGKRYIDRWIEAGFECEWRRR
jgi:hypothetical protein